MPSQRVVTILSALPPEGDADGAVALCMRALRERLPILVGDAVDIVHHRLEDEMVAHCLGCFECWTKTPGQCRIQDDADGVVASLIQSDIVIQLSPLRFGSYGAGLKRALDRSIGLIEPFFEKREGEVHHAKRYPHYPRTLSIAVSAPGAPEAWTQTFTALVERNAINLHTKSKALVIAAEQSEREIDEAVCAALETLIDFNTDFPMRHFEALEPRATDDTWLVPATPRALVLVGSARPEGQSTSGSLAQTLVDELAPLGFSSEVIRLNTLINRDTPLARTQLFSAVEKSDLLIIATPLYVDALPALLLEAMEMMAAHTFKTAPAVVGLLNCGFPEAEHCFLAIDILAHFCRDNNFPWLGAIALGGGESVAGRPLSALGGQMAHVRAALNEAATAIADGHAVPASVISAVARPSMPTSMYTVAGGLGWRYKAWKAGALGHMHDRPLEPGHPSPDDSRDGPKHKHPLTLLPDDPATFSERS